MTVSICSCAPAPTIPALVCENGEVLVGKRRSSPTWTSASRSPPGSEAHRLKAIKARKRELEEAAPMLGTRYALTGETSLSPPGCGCPRPRGARRRQGFGILTEIDVQATLKEKLDIDGEPYVILGACNPSLAHQALEAEPDLGVLLPCNVVVYERGGVTHVSAVDAERMLSIVECDELAAIAEDVRARLAAVVDRVVSSDQR